MTCSNFICTYRLQYVPRIAHSSMNKNRDCHVRARDSVPQYGPCSDPQALTKHVRYLT